MGRLSGFPFFIIRGVQCLLSCWSRISVLSGYYLMINSPFFLRISLLWLLAIAPFSAHAAEGVFGYSQANGPWYSSPTVACSIGAAKGYEAIAHSGMASGYYCWFERATDWVYGPLNKSWFKICPEGGYPDTTKPAASQCPDPAPVCSDKNPFVRKFLFRDGSNKYPTAIDGCAVTVKSQLICRVETISNIKSTYCMLELVRTGEPGSQAESSVTAAPPGATENANDPRVTSPPVSPETGNCPAGTVQAGVTASGKPICIGTGKTPETTQKTQSVTKPATTVNNPDGSTTQTQEVVKSNRDGSTTTTTTTIQTAADGTKTLSSSAETIKADGTQGKSDEGEKEKSFCEQNPTLSICRQSSVNGECGEVECNGDAVQCATLRAATKMQCAMEEDKKLLSDSPLNRQGTEISSGVDPLEGTLPTKQNGSTVNVSSSLDTSGWLGAGSGFSDVSFSLQGKLITIPFSKWMQYLLVLRYALMVVASLVSFRILSGSILGK